MTLLTGHGQRRILFGLDYRTLPFIHDMSLSLTGFVYTIFYVPLLLVNAMAILSEDRFLARSSSPSLSASPHTLKHAY